ncbi:hypothetical protein QJQ45_010449 [Haematococcus lacustris]|nr:hypothetical protein QJQ45_010449 [Haematococcus lacustris]
MSAKPKNTSHVGGQPPGKPFGLAAHSSGHEHSIAPVGGFIRAEMTLNMQRIGESKWCPLELCWWPEQGKLPAKGKEYPGLGYKQLRDKPPKAQQQQQQPAEAHWGDEYRVRVADVGEDQTGAKGSILHGSEDGAAGHIVAVRYEFVRSSAAGQDV